MSYAYDEYLAEHIGNVNKGLHWMLDNLGLSQEENTAIETAMVSFNHDESKYSTEEYDAYDRYFYGGNRSYKVVQDFNYAWLHHIHQNPHHWQYWVLMEDDPEAGLPYKTLMIPLPYIFEMIADWWSFSWKSGNLFEIFNWYAEHRDKQYINLNSRMILERVLEKIWDVLIMQETVRGRDISEIEGQYRRFWVEQKMDQLNLEHSDTEDSDEGLYGIPEIKKFPMPDKKHVKSAIRFFNYVDPKYEKELADSILEKAKEFGLDLENDISVGDENRFGKYISEDHLAHSGRKGQKWGVQNGPPYPLDQDTVKTEYGSDAKIMESNKSSDSESDGEKKHHKSKVSSVKKELTAQANELKKEYKRLANDPNTDPEYLKLVEMEINDLKEEADARQRMAKQNNPTEYYTPVTKSLLELHPVEKLEDLKKLDDNADIEKVRNNINHPEGEGGIGRHYNCPNCAAAFELTERGYDVIARPKKTGSNVENIEDFFKDGKLMNMGGDTEIGEFPFAPDKLSVIPSVRKRQQELSKEAEKKFWNNVDIAAHEVEGNIYQAANKQGIGARGVLVVGWIEDPFLSKRTTAFHAMNYMVVKGKNGKPEVKVFDAQSSRKYKQNGDVELFADVLYDADPRDVYLMRTDNLELADKITEAVYSNRKG